MTIPEQNRQKIKELIPEAQWAAEQWLSECEKKNLLFRIAEVYRSQQRQDMLILMGRDSEDDFWMDYQYGKMTLSTAKRGIQLLKLYGPFEQKTNKVTYTLDSNHTQRIAADIYPINCTHKQIEAIAKQFGITHPLGWDPPHYEFDKAMQRPQPIPTPEARLKGLERRLKTAVGEMRDMILRLIERLNKRIY